MMDYLRCQLAPYRSRVILSATIALFTFAFGIAYAVLTVDHAVILNEAMTMQDSLTYKVIKPGG